jgi:hypothetical protein
MDNMLYSYWCYYMYKLEKAKEVAEKTAKIWKLNDERNKEKGQ